MLSVAILLWWWKIWFADDKFLKFYSCSQKNKVQSEHIYVSVGIVGLSHVRARQCTITPSLQDVEFFWITRRLISCSHVAHCWYDKHFSLVNQISSPLKQGSSWQHQLRLSICTYDTLWHQHYVTTSKEYLINCHILLQYLELVFLQLELVQILCKIIIIWMNYEKKQKGSFLWNTRY